MTLKEIQDEVIKKYRIKLNEHSDCWGRMHAHVKQRMICKWKQTNSIRATFDLLHEVGHIETTKSWMRRAESEYYATMWAIYRCREYGIKIPKKLFNLYQKYIDMEIDRGIRRGGSGYSELKLPMLTGVIAE